MGLSSRGTPVHLVLLQSEWYPSESCERTMMQHVPPTVAFVIDWLVPPTDIVTGAPKLAPVSLA
jgi:hypothetical protein